MTLMLTEVESEPLKPPGLWGTLYDVVKSPYYETFMMLFILANAVVLASDHYGQDPENKAIFDHVNAYFVIFFLAELLVNLVAQG